MNKKRELTLTEFYRECELRNYAAQLQRGILLQSYRDDCILEVLENYEYGATRLQCLRSKQRLDETQYIPGTLLINPAKLVFLPLRHAHYISELVRLTIVGHSMKKPEDLLKWNSEYYDDY